MSVEVKVPILPESVADAIVAVWHVKVGDAVSIDDNLVDIETEKVVLEVPATVDGVIKELRVEEGATVGEQDVIAIIEEGATAKTTEPTAGHLRIGALEHGLRQKRLGKDRGSRGTRPGLPCASAHRPGEPAIRLRP